METFSDAIDLLHLKLSELVKTERINKATINAFNKVIETLCNQYNKINKEIALQNELLATQQKELDNYKLLYGDLLVKIRTANNNINTEIVPQDTDSIYFEYEEPPF